MFTSQISGGSERLSAPRPFNIVSSPRKLSESERLRRFIIAKYDHLRNRPTVVFDPLKLREIGLQSSDPIEVVADVRAWYNPDKELELGKQFESVQRNERAWNLGYGFIENVNNQYCFAIMVDHLVRHSIPEIDDDSFFSRLSRTLQQPDSLIDRLFQVNGMSAARGGNELTRRALIGSSLYIYSKCYPNLNA